MSFSLKQIRYFITAAKCGQISRAAVELNVSQSAVTTAIRQLEELLDIKMFVRSSTGVMLTREGQQFMRHAQEIIAYVDQAMNLQCGAGDSASGEVRVGVTYVMLGYFLAPHLARFQRLYPNINVQIEETPRNVVEQQTAEGAFDISLALVQSSAKHDKELIVKKLSRSPRRVWLSANHPLLALETIGLEDIAKEPYIALTIDDAWENAQRYWELTPFRPKVVVQTSCIEALRTMVASGMGVSILSDMIYRHWSLDGLRIETRDTRETLPTVDASILIPARARLKPAAQTLVNFLHRNCSL